MMHSMKLQEKYFNYILYGTKKIELRLYDDKRKNIKVGDIIEFTSEDALEKKFKAKVIALLIYDCFDNLFSDFPVEYLADKEMNKKELIKVLEEFYSAEKQKKYGVIGIKIEVI